MGLFGKGHEKPPKELVNEWSHKMRKEGYNLERQIKAIQREEEKTKKLLKASAKRGETESCRILAKEIMKARKVVNKLYTSKAHINSVQMSMKNQLASLRLAGALEKSTQVMTSMQALVKVPEIQATMRELSKEMMKAGIMEEMMEDTMEMADDEELDDEADEEVDKVLFELTAGVIGKAPAAVNDSLPTGELEGATGVTPSASHDDDEDEEEMDEMKARLEALRS
ncbi:charged multivesicular body protein 3-like [Haliotis asinina]|uniref:charged multivesicular body protein 3-like n=1 Tax=Haliotis asinina TaxID=109174 RepID=UPI003531D66A